MYLSFSKILFINPVLAFKAKPTTFGVQHLVIKTASTKVHYFLGNSLPGTGVDCQGIGEKNVVEYTFSMGGCAGRKVNALC